MIKLYTKTHNTTGLKYLGKTSAANCDKYKGSGKYWKNHIAKHGYSVKTEVLYEFDDKDTGLMLTALWLSHKFDIVESAEWANLQAETGYSGISHGTKRSKYKQRTSALSKETRKLQSLAKKRDWERLGFRAHFEKPCSSATKNKISNARAGKKWLNDGIVNKCVSYDVFCKMITTSNWKPGIDKNIVTSKNKGTQNA